MMGAHNLALDSSTSVFSHAKGKDKKQRLFPSLVEAETNLDRRLSQQGARGGWAEQGRTRTVVEAEIEGLLITTQTLTEQPRSDRNKGLPSQKSHDRTKPNRYPLKPSRN